MENSQNKTVQFTGEEFIQIGEIAKPFWERGTSSDTPKFVIFMGGIGAGKTTIRREQFAEGYVHFDFGEIYTAIEKAFGGENEKLSEYALFASSLILQESINSKKNIVIEIIGDSQEVITPVIDGMKSIGYEISISAINADVAEAYQRHIKAVNEDPEYISSYYTQEATLASIYSYFGLQMPAMSNTDSE